MARTRKNVKRKIMDTIMVLILVAAALTAGWNPVYIWSDIGWYLSFLAFFGILMLAPQIFKRFWKVRIN